ncbi:MAG: hypothetical protein ACREQO_01175 [Candidatus Binatia bacterium]
MLNLSTKWASYLVSQPEAGMSYQIVTVQLNDGREFPRAVVTGGFITQIDGHADIPFAEQDIVELIVTNDTTWLCR